MEIEERDVSGCDWGTPQFRWLCDFCGRRGHWTVSEAEALLLRVRHRKKSHWHQMPGLMHHAAVARMDEAPRF